MIQHSGRNQPNTSNQRQQQQQQQQQPRLFNRMSGFLFQKRQGASEQEDYSAASSSTTATTTPLDTVNNSTHGDGQAHSYYTALDEDTTPRVDSMFSTIRSNYSNMHANPNTPPPIRTVRLNDGIVHNPGGNIPSSRLPLQSTSPSSTTSENSTNNSTDNTSATDDFNQAFEKMAHEYGLPNDVAKTLPMEAKQVLLRNSQASNFQQLNNNNTGLFSWRTWGIQKKQKQHMDLRQDRFFEPSASATLSSSALTDDPGNNANDIRGGNDRQRAYSTSARNRSQRISIMTFAQHNNDTATTRRKKPSGHRHDRTIKKGLSSPEYFIHLLKDCHVRNLDESQVQELRVCLRSVKASWTTQFLQLGGYIVLSDLFRQMNHAPKRSPNDDKILQHLAKCFKAIMTHEQAGIAIVLTNPVGLCHIRDLLFGQVDQKQRSLYSLSVSTRAHFLNILCTLANLQTTQSETIPYIHGYDVLRRLLLDCPETTRAPSTQPGSSDSLSTYSIDDHNDNAEFPFRMTLKEDPQDLMKIIFEDDPFYTSGQPLKPRYTAWMRELQYTVEKEIEPITFLAQVLDYKFESAFRQLRIKPSGSQQQQQDPPAIEEEDGIEFNVIDQKQKGLEKGTGIVNVDDGVVEYLIAHLRLINTIVATQPTFQTTNYDDRGREKVRLEIMMSGFDKIAKALQCCPHPTLYAFYFRYLQTLLQPLANIYPPRPSSLPIANAHQEQNRDSMVRWEDEVRQASSSAILFEQPPWADDSFDEDDSDGYEDYESDQDEDRETFHYYASDNDEDDLGITSVRDQEYRWKMGAAVAR